MVYTNKYRKEFICDNKLFCLNFGHTICHGVESFFQFKKYTHGESVAIGMYLILKIMEKIENNVMFIL